MTREAVGFYNSVCNQATYSIPARLFPMDHESATGTESGTSTPAQPSLASVTDLIHWTIRNLLTEPQHPATLVPLALSVLDAKSKNAKWKFLQSVDLRDLVEVAGGMSTEKLLQYGHSLHLLGSNGTMPLWHVCVNLCRPRRGVSSSEVEVDVAFFFSHAIGDGFSGLAFHDAFVEALRTRMALIDKGINPDQKLVDPVIPLDMYNPQDLRQSLEDAIPDLILTWGGIWKFVKSMFVSPHKTTWVGPKIQLPSSKDSATGAYNCGTKISMLTVPAEDVAVMRKLCKENKTTITAYLTFLLADAIASLKNDIERNYQSGSKKEIEKISADIAISLRRKKDLMPKAGQPNFMVSYTTSYTHPFYISPSGNRIVSPEIFEKLKKLGGSLEDAGKSKVSVKDWARERGQEIDWKEIRRLKRGLIQCGNSTRDHLVTYLKLIGNYTSYSLGRAGKERGASFEVSNLGVLDLVTFREMEEKRRYKKMKRRFPESEVQIVDVVFSQSASVTGSPLTFSVATLRDGDMNVVLCVQEGIKLEELGERVLMELARRLGIRR